MAQSPKEVDALRNPLEVDKQTVKEYKIEPQHDVPPVKKQAFLQAQLGELEAAFWRARMDVVHANRLMQSDVEALRVKGGNNLVEHKNQVKQFYSGIVMVKKLIEQLREEYPELKVKS